MFDIGHGAGSFNFEAARKAMDQGFLPDTISTDVYTASINGPVFDMPTTINKMRHLGMSFDYVLLRAQQRPRRSSIVSRAWASGADSPADIALLTVEHGQFKLVDAEWNAVTIEKRLGSRLTICRGKRLVAPV